MVEEMHVMDLKSMKKGEVFEFIDEDSLDERKRKAVKALREILDKKPDITDRELMKEMRKKMHMLDIEDMDIRDSLPKRNWGIIKKISDSGGKVRIEIQRIEKKDYHKYIDILAEHIADQMSKTNIKDLVKDALADRGLEPEKLKKFAEKKEKVKVEAKRGCFNIVLDKKTIIPVR